MATTIATLTIQQAVLSATPTDFIAIVTTRSIQSNRAHVLVMDESCAPRNVRITFYGNDCNGLELIKAGDAMRFNGMYLISSSKRDLYILHDFKKKTRFETDKPTWTRLADGESRLDHNEDNYWRVTELLRWYNQRNELVVESLPCRRRQFQEIEAVGLMSHVCVRVIALDVANSRQEFKNRRSSIPVSTIATLLDDHGDVASLVGCERFQESMKLALTNGERIQISFVQSTPPAEGHTSLSLTTTSSTTVSRCSPEKQWKNQTTNTQSFSILPEERTTKTFTASIDRIFIPELNTALEEKHFLSPNAFTELLVNQETQTFRSIILTIQGSSVLARSEVVQILCGSVDAGDVSSHVKTCRHVLELIRGLLEENVELQWTIEKAAGEEFKVTHVTLL